MSAPVPTLGPCADCGRERVSGGDWKAIPRDERKELRRSHCRHGGGRLCESCLRYSQRADGHDIRRRLGSSMNRTNITVATLDSADTYTGGWARKGLVLVPDSTGKPLETFGEAS